MYQVHLLHDRPHALTLLKFKPPKPPILQDNLIRGRFLAELTREVFSDLEASKYQHAEMRISIYGRKQVGVINMSRWCHYRRNHPLTPLLQSRMQTQVEWDILAAWVVANNLASNNVVWLIQIPRLYNVYRDQGIIENFAQVGVDGISQLEKV